MRDFKIPTTPPEVDLPTQTDSWFVKVPTEMVARRMKGLESQKDWLQILGVYTTLLLWAAPWEGWIPFYDEEEGDETPTEEAARTAHIPIDTMERALRYLTRHGLVMRTDDGLLYLPDAKSYTERVTAIAMGKRAERAAKKEKEQTPNGRDGGKEW